MTGEKDIVLIHFEEKPLVFARIEDISPDMKRGWHRVKMLILQVPLQVVTWILREAYINGESFTMGGKNIRMEKVICPTDSGDGGDEENVGRPGKVPKSGKIISLADKKKR